MSIIKAFKEGLREGDAVQVEPKYKDGPAKTALIVASIAVLSPTALGEIVSNKPTENKEAKAGASLINYALLIAFIIVLAISLF